MFVFFELMFDWLIFGAKTAIDALLNFQFSPRKRSGLLPLPQFSARDHGFWFSRGPVTRIVLVCAAIVTSAEQLNGPLSRLVLRSIFIGGLERTRRWGQSSFISAQRIVKHGFWEDHFDSSVLVFRTHV
jgi:hypothetical protein